MYAAAIDTLSAAGLEHYEVSNFARPGHRCRHNEIYWAGGGYYAAGPGRGPLRRRPARNEPSQHDHLAAAACWPASRPSPRARPCRRAIGLASCWSSACGGSRESSGNRLPGSPALRSTSWSATNWPNWRGWAWWRSSPSGVRLTRAGLFVSDAIWPRLLEPRHERSYRERRPRRLRPSC